MRISEQFYSIQGEGVSTGVPAYFIRLQGCNLMCGGQDASLLKEGKASWYCDTEKVWRQGKEYSNTDLVDKIDNAGILKRVLEGRVHLIWTGGEPTTRNNREGIVGFLDYIETNAPLNGVYNEIETNGTVFTDGFLDNYIEQINCSPKLSNSGMPKERRINDRAIREISYHKNSWFKFVVGNNNDIEEAERDFIRPYNIEPKQVILMPGVDNLKDLPERTNFIYEAGKQYGYRAVTRGHILAWDKTTGV